MTYDERPPYISHIHIHIVLGLLEGPDIYWCLGRENPDIMNYLTDIEQYVKGIFNNSENMIINELNEIFKENMNR